MTEYIHVKGITICQPHAWAIMAGIKRFENRTWPSRYRGPVLIHAGKSKEWLDEDGIYPGEPPRNDLVFGAIIGVVDMIGCHHIRTLKYGEGYANGPWCHEYVNPRPCYPVEYKGSLSYWNAPAGLISAVMEESRALERAG